MVTQTYQRAVVVGLAEFLTSHSLGVYREGDTVYAPGERGIYVETDIAEDAAEGIGLAVYFSSSSGTYRTDQEDTVTAVQVAYRVPTRLAGADLYDALHDLLHRQRVLLADGHLNLFCTEQSASPLGQDENGRWMFVQNFQFSGLRARSA